MDSDFLLIYGTETGQSKAIAEDICSRAEQEFNLKPRLFSMEKTEKEFWIEKERCAVIVISSTGDGDPPEQATRFVRRLNHTAKPNGLKSLRYALLGLGDSNYSTFMGCPNLVKKRLTELGAQSFYRFGQADDATDLEESVEPWIEGLFPALKSCLNNLPPVIAPEPEKPKDASKSQENSLISTLSAQFSCKLALNHTENDSKLEVCNCVWPDGLCLIRGNDSIRAETELRVPVASIPYLEICYGQGKFDPSTVPWQNGDLLSGMVPPIHKVIVLDNKQLSKSGASKDKFEISIDIQGTEMCYQPGDALYFIFENDRTEVEYILKRLNLLEKADQSLEIVIQKDTKNEKATIAPYLPPKCSARYLLSDCLDIRRTPGRPVLRVLSEYCSNADEKRRLLELCSAQGVKEFTALVRKSALSLADILHGFQSCKPTLERLVELLPRLQPRPYSFASSTLNSHSSARFVYSTIKTEKLEGRFYERIGICTNWLMQRKTGDEISVILKEPSRFRFPSDAEKIPLIFIGPGTGVAPFLGFLQQLRIQDQNAGVKCNEVERWLFFGCRDWNVDFIYKDEIVLHYRLGTLTNLILCESRASKPQPSVPKYVQDAMGHYGPQLAEMITKENECGHKAKIFVCGDAKGMSRDVFEAFVKVLNVNAGMTEMESREYLMKMKQEENYLEDVWS